LRKKWGRKAPQFYCRYEKKHRIIQEYLGPREGQVHSPKLRDNSLLKERGGQWELIRMKKENQ